MAEGFDCSTPLTAATAAAFKSDGFEFVCRYLVPSGWKALTGEEADLISESGLYIVSVFETTADRALGGRAAGLNDGAVATRTAAQVGQPEGSAIYFAVDFDARPSQMQTVLEYIRAAGETSPGFFTGVYGSYAVIEAAKAEGVCSRYWQTYAWSYGAVADGIHLFQYENDIIVNGIAIDRDRSFGNEGWWKKGQPIPGEEDDMQLEQWQWKMLGDSLDGLYRKGLIGDYRWAEKAYKGEMKASELAWLNTVITARQNGVQV